MSVAVGMRGVRLIGSALLVVACVPVARAADVPAGQVIASRNACMGCHAVDRKLVGPAFQQIAAKYKGDGEARAKLSRKVRDGGSGVWGVIPMPSHPSMSDADIRTVVDWVLAGAPAK
jgi:cytochrome c